MNSSIDFTTQVYSYDRILRPFAINLTKNREDSEDLIQDTFFRAISNKDKFAEGTNIKAWLFTIMKNIFINNYRKNQKRNTITDSSDNQYLLNSTKKVVKNEAYNKFLIEDINTALASVNKDFTEPFLMYYEGFKYQEIAEKLDLPLGTVKSRIFFARKELQNRLRNAGISNSSNN
jgi:RNA polymerase sigma-70 factor (ECF subfamily)